MYFRCILRFFVVDNYNYIFYIVHRHIINLFDNIFDDFYKYIKGGKNDKIY